jgi:putative membrane protein
MGALLAMIIAGLLNRSLQRDFAREWADSLRIKHPRPLGADAIARMLKKKTQGH